MRDDWSSSGSSWSRMMNATQHQYAQIDKELLAIIKEVKKFNNYLYGKKFEIRINHKSLLGILASDKSTLTIFSPRMQGWSIMLMDKVDYFIHEWFIMRNLSIKYYFWRILKNSPSWQNILHGWLFKTILARVSTGFCMSGQLMYSISQMPVLFKSKYSSNIKESFCDVNSILVFICLKNSPK